METINEKMKVISNTSFEGERPLFASRGLRLENVKILPGESSLKHCSDIEVANCEFSGKYPFWHNENVWIADSLFHEGARAAIWYVKNLRMMDTVVEAPKMFREIDGLFLENVKLPYALETCWNCRNVELHNVEVQKGDYIFMNNENMKIDGFLLQGNYSFQYAKNVEIHNAEMHTKDAFWHSENVTVYDSLLDGEYLGWHSHNLRLVNCKITGTQPLCYAHNLVMENCTMAEDADLAFEYSTVQAQINGHITSVKNPGKGSIKAQSIGEIIVDEYGPQPGACEIKTEE